MQLVGLCCDESVHDLVDCPGLMLMLIGVLLVVDKSSKKRSAIVKDLDNVNISKSNLSLFKIALFYIICMAADTLAVLDSVVIYKTCSTTDSVNYC